MKYAVLPRRASGHWCQRLEMSSSPVIRCLMHFFALTLLTTPILTIFIRPDVVTILKHGGIQLLFVRESHPILRPVKLNFTPSACQWRHSQTAWFCHSESEADSPSFEGQEELGPLECHGRTHSQLCMSDLQRTMLVGPFFSRPGEWHSIGSACQSATLGCRSHQHAIAQMRSDVYCL